MSEKTANNTIAVIKLIVGIVVALVVLVWMLYLLAVSGYRYKNTGDGTDYFLGQASSEAIAARLKPEGVVAVGSGLPPGSRDGETIYKKVCYSCHATGLSGSPKFGDSAAWGPRIAKGYDTLIQHSEQGFNAMPARGGDPSLTNDEMARAVAYMANAAGAKFNPPAVGGNASGAAGETMAVGGQLDPEVAGKKVFDSLCFTCHAPNGGIAAAPKLGDKAAWAPRIKDGFDAVLAIATKGTDKGMAPRGGYTGSDAEFRAAVQYMYNHAK